MNVHNFITNLMLIILLYVMLYCMHETRYKCTSIILQYEINRENTNSVFQVLYKSLIPHHILFNVFNILCSYTNISAINPIQHSYIYIYIYIYDRSLHINVFVNARTPLIFKINFCFKYCEIKIL